MMTNANFVGSEDKNISIIPVAWSDRYTIIQTVIRNGSENHATAYNVTQMMVNSTELSNLITALVLRYNDLSEGERGDMTLELRRVIQEKPVSPENEDIPY